MKLETEKHALKLSHLSVIKQQRVLKRLARNCRIHANEKMLNAESAEANTYDWHRNVRLKREARAYNLIRAYLKGIPYKQVEQSLKPTTIMPQQAFWAATVAPIKNDGVLWLEVEKWLEAE